MATVAVSYPDYNEAHGVIIDPDGGDVEVRVGQYEVEILADRAGLRDLARWCLALADDSAPFGSHIHLDPNVSPLTPESLPLLIARRDAPVPP